MKLTCVFVILYNESAEYDNNADKLHKKLGSAKH
jgi:hypothetical protein